MNFLLLSAFLPAMAISPLPGSMPSGCARPPAPDYRFDASISRAVLDNYLSRSISMEGLLNGRGDLDDNIRMLNRIGARFIGRSICLWGHESQLLANFARARIQVPKVLAGEPDRILEACIFEIVTAQVEQVPIPAWAFTALGMPAQQRNFCYADMLYADGRSRDQWGKGASVPDVSRPETRLWFYFLAASYIDLGFEAIHYGQVELMNKNDPDLVYWSQIFQLAREYAHVHARRHLLLCDAHTPGGGLLKDGRLLLDFHAFPLRIKELPDKTQAASPDTTKAATPDRPQAAVLELGFSDGLYRRSKGGLTPSGWTCDHLPYLVEFDNYGVSSAPGQPGQGHGGFDWIWGYDEITWFAHQTRQYRADWLRYAWDWVHRVDTNGHLEMPGSRTMTSPLDHKKWYYANDPGPAVPEGLGDEEAILTIWTADVSPPRRFRPPVVLLRRLRRPKVGARRSKNPDCPEALSISWVSNDLWEKILSLPQLMKRLLFCIAAILLIRTSDLAQSYGLVFSSHEVVQEKRTSLDLSPEDSLCFTKNFDLAFDINFLPRHEIYFGYVFRIIALGNGGNDQNIDLIYNQRLATFKVIIGENFSGISFPVDSLRLYRGWNTFALHCDLEKHQLLFRLDGRTVGSSPIPDIGHCFKFIWGANDFRKFRTRDIPPMQIKDIRLSDNGSPKYDWPLNETSGETVTDKLGRQSARVKNPIWLKPKFQQWDNIGSFMVKGYAGVAYNAKQDKLFIIGSDSITAFTFTKDGFATDGIPYRHTDLVLGHQNIYDTLTDRLLDVYIDRRNVNTFSFVGKEWEQNLPYGPLTEYWHANKFLSATDSSLYIIGGYGQLRYKNLVQRYHFPTHTHWRQTTKTSPVITSVHWPPSAPIPGANTPISPAAMAARQVTRCSTPGTTMTYSVMISNGAPSKGSLASSRWPIPLLSPTASSSALNRMPGMAFSLPTTPITPNCS